RAALMASFCEWTTEKRSTPELIALAAAKLSLTLHAPGAPITERPIEPIEPIEPIQPPPEGEPAAQAGEDIPPEDPIDSAPPRVRFTPVEGSTTKLIDVDTGDEIDLSEYAVNDLKVFARVNSLKVNLRASHEELQSAVYAAAIAAPSAEE
ncbi:MAG TPA: hypothetical protein PLZ93_15165, partial [Nocardioides sp.]|nr:hypothetical protein [Nocardioides sp.]